MLFKKKFDDVFDNDITTKYFNVYDDIFEQYYYTNKVLDKNIYLFTSNYAYLYFIQILSSLDKEVIKNIVKIKRNTNKQMTIKSVLNLNVQSILKYKFDNINTVIYNEIFSKYNVINKKLSIQTTKITKFPK
jgi:hypothetical protein